MFVPIFLISPLQVLKGHIKFPQSLLFSSTKSLRLSSRERCSSPLVIFLALLWTLSIWFMSFLCWRPQSWMLYHSQDWKVVIYHMFSSLELVHWHPRKASWFFLLLGTLIAKNIVFVCPLRHCFAAPLRSFIFSIMTISCNVSPVEWRCFVFGAGWATESVNTILGTGLIKGYTNFWK